MHVAAGDRRSSEDFGGTARRKYGVPKNRVGAPRELWMGMETPSRGPGATTKTEWIVAERA